jgi:thiol:disulfide interchange protein DsbD
MNVLIRSTLILAATVGVAGLAAAKPWWLRGASSNESDFLPPDVAFRVGSRVDGNTVRVRWVIADGYYLYRKRFDIAAESPDLWLGDPTFPPGTPKTDAYLGEQEIFTQQVEATAEFKRSDFGAHPMQIKVTYQGCAEAGLCYPPITKVLFPQNAGTTGQTLGANAANAANQPSPWQIGAMVGGGVAFLLAGFVLRKGRRLPTPN